MNLPPIIHKTTQQYRTLIIIGVLTFCIPTSIFANPSLNNIAAGQVTVEQTQTTTTVNQTSQKAILNWNSFNIGNGEHTHFQQPNGGVALNRINPTQGASEIYGRLTATGQIILVNPAGIHFGPNAYVNVGGLIASTANISNEDFLNGYYRFSNDPNFNGAIHNQGHIIAADNGLVALIGGAVNNDGMIQANMGYVVLASGNEFTMSLAGNNLVSFTVDDEVTGRAVDYRGNEIEDGIQNTGDILAHGGQVLVTAKAASGVLDHVINLEGRVEVVSAYTENGELILTGDTNSGVVRIAGEIDASGKRNGESGGNVTITGYNILIDEGASVDVSGNVGGGKINVGGNYLGQGPLPTANSVVMRDGANLNASAIDNGDGGTVIIWSDHYSNVSGEILARGGDASGDGGFIETSSKSILIIGSLTIDTTASVGATGEWLLDPADIYIADSQANATTAGMVGADNSADTGTGGDPDTFTSSGAADSFLSTGNLETALAGANVIVRTDGGSGGDGDIFVVDNITWTSGNTLTFLADRYIQINAGISGINGSLNLSAANLAQSITTDYTNGSIDVYNFNITAGHWYQNNATLPAFNVRGSFETNSGNGPDFTSDSVSFLRAVGGNGSTGDPFELTDVYGLQGMGSSDTNLDFSYELANDIDALSTRNWRSGEGFRPVGDTSLFTITPFSYLSDFNGNFDGQGFVIDGLYLNSNDNGVAMFGLASANPGQFISNVGLTNVDITSISSTSLDTAALIAAFSGSTISNVYVTGTIRNNDTRTDGSVGAIAAQLTGTLTNSYNAATIIVNNNERAGGLVGYNHGTITNSYNIGDVIKNTTGGSAGGLVGHNDTFATIEQSYNAGNVSGGAATGGLVGVNMGNGFSGGTITNSYNIGSVTGTIAGGIAGTSQEDSEVSFSYNSGAVSGSTYEGGVLGRNINTVTLNNLFFDSDTSGVTVAVGNGTDTITATGAGCFTGSGCAAGSADLSLNTTFAGWSITNIGGNTAANQGATPPGTTWLIINEATRPLLTSEWSTDVRTAHQLQLMAAAVDADYTLIADIDLSAALNNAADVWNSTSSGVLADQGFYPIGYTDTSNPTSNVYGNGTPIGTEFSGSFNGNGYIIDNLYMNYESGNAAGIQIAGLFGGIDGTQAGTIIENLSLTNANVTSLEGAGALAGTLGDGTIRYVYVEGTVTGLGGPDPFGGVGGVVGSLVPSNALIHDSYAEVNVTSTDPHGAFTGWFNEGSAVIRDSYATGTVGAGGHGFAYVPGGYAGTLTDNYFDSDTTGTTSGVTTGVAAFTTAQMTDFNTAGIYNTWDITTTPSTTATKPGNAWIMFDDITRPILLMEHRTEIKTPHQLQLMGSTLGADYSLQNDINMNDAMTNPADVWGTNTGGPSGAGFAPVGNTTDRYSGTFSGNNHVISNLYFASGSGSGFFGGTSSTAVIQNIGIEDVTIINGGTTVGGIVASNLGTITNSYTTGSIAGGANIGGIAGYNNGTITNSYNTANVQAAGSYLNSMGGITGYNDASGIVITTFNSGLINTINDGGAFSAYGGLVGTNIGSINTSYNTGNVYGYTNFNGNSGGIAGSNSGIITNTYNTGSVRVPSNTTITNTGFGGIAGGNSGTISDSYSIGYVVKPGGTNYTGGLVGNNAGTVTNSFWDTATSGQSIAVENGSSAGMTGGCYTTSSCANGGTVNLTQEINFTGWDFSNTWNIVEDNSYPYLNAFYQADPNIISGTTGLAANNSVVVAFDGENVDTTYTRADGAFYEIYGNNMITGIDSSIATNTPTLLYLSSAAHAANLVALADSVTSFVNSDLTTPDKFQVGHTTASTLSFTSLATAVGSLSGSDILYSASGNDITVSNNIDLNTDTNTTLDVNGNLTMTGSGELTLAGPVNLNTNNAVFTITADSNISGVINDAANTYGFTKEGAGTLVLSANNTYDGDTTITAGELRAGTDTALGTGIIILNGGRLGSDTTTVTLANNINVTANSEIRLGFGANLNLTGVIDDISNTYDISLFNTGFLSLFGDNSNFDGDFIVPASTILVAQHNNALGSNVGGVIANSGQLRIYGGIDIGNEAITLNGGTLNGESGGTAISSGPVTVIGSGILSTGNSNILDVQGVISESGGAANITIGGSSTVILSGNNTYTGTTNIGSGTLQIGNSGTSGAVAGNIVNSSALIFDRTDSYDYAGVISGTGTLSKSGAGTLTLSGVNTYTGDTSISAGSISVASVANAGTDSPLGASGAINISSAGTLLYTGSGHSSNRAITISGDGGTINASGTGSLTLSGGITGANNDLVLTGSGDATVSGNITNTDGTVTVSGSGIWTFSGTNTYGVGASTIIDGGTLSIASDAALGCVPDGGGCAPIPDPDNIQLLNGGTLQTTATFEIDSGRGITLGTGGGTIDVNSGTLTYNGVIAGANPLTFDGPGTFETDTNITAPSSLTFNSNLGFNFGGTEISSSNGNLDLSSGVTLISTSNVKLDANGTGADLTVGNITWTGTNTVALESADQIDINGAISGVNGELTLTAANTSQSIETDYTNGTIDVYDFHLIGGQWYQVNATLPAFNVANSFTIANDAQFSGATHPARFLRAAGGDGNSTGTAYQLVDIYGVQGINSGNISSDLLTKNYILANDIDATGTRNWNDGLGFRPIGYWYLFGAGNAFTGNFNGNNKVIDGLYINRSQTETGSLGEMGSALFAVTYQPRIYDLGLTNLDVTSQNSRAAGLVAFASWQANPGWGGGSGAFFDNIYTTGRVTSHGSAAGGILSYAGAGNTLRTSYNAASVTATGGGLAGGVLGYLTGGSVVSDSYNIGTVTAYGQGTAGGFVADASGGTLSNSYSSGEVYNPGAVAGGFVGNRTGGTISNNYYDTETSRTASASSSGSTAGITGETTASMMQETTFSGWSITNNVETDDSEPVTTWFVFEGSTRPLLMMEYSTEIRNPHQLQLMGTTLDADYAIVNDIDLSSAFTNKSDVWATDISRSYAEDGFVPIGPLGTSQFTGELDGQHYTISNFYSATIGHTNQGLFAYTSGDISDIDLFNAYVYNRPDGGLSSSCGTTSCAGNGILAGFNGGTITNASTSGTLIRENGNAGGLVGTNFGDITDSSSSVDIILTDGGTNVGGLVGYNRGVNTSGMIGTINTSNSNGSITSTEYVSNVGGLVGGNGSGIINNSYSTTNISIVSGYNIGGFVGGNGRSITIGSGSGADPQAFITNSYSSGSVSISDLPDSNNIGGFAGLNNNTGFVGDNISNSFWDTDSSGQSAAHGVNLIDPSSGNGMTGGCFTGTCANGGTENLTAFNTFNTAGWNISNTPNTGATAPSEVWFVFEGSTRPLLMAEYSTNIKNVHQLQLMGTTLDADYQLKNDINLSASLSDTSEVWGTNSGTATGAGFLPIGYTANFSGSLDGNNYAIENLYMDYDAATEIGYGLFGSISGANISNVGLTNPNINVDFFGGEHNVGIAVGYTIGTNTIDNVSVEGGSVSATDVRRIGGFGGLVQPGTTVTDSYTSANVNYTTNNSIVTPQVGGFIGGLSGDVDTSYSAGDITVDAGPAGTSPSVGGFAGQYTNARIDNTYTTSSITYTANAISNLTSSRVGGFLGNMDHSSGYSLTNSYASGTITAAGSVGGFIGVYNAGNATIANNFWDTDTDGGTYNAAGSGTPTGITGADTATLMTLANFDPEWDITATGSTTRQAPNNLWFIFEGNTRPLLMMENTSNIRNTHQLQMMAAALDAEYKLKNNVDFSALTETDVWGVDFSGTPALGSGFVPVGSNVNTFSGRLNGQGYTINSLKLQSSGDYLGLFGFIASSGAMDNIGLTNTVILGATNTSDSVGGIAGQNAGTITNSYVTGSARGFFYIGGITGVNSGRVTDSYSTASVSGSNFIGGIAGDTSSASYIAKTYNTGYITNYIYGDRAGGIAGRNYGVITSSFNTGTLNYDNVLYTARAGGIAGENFGTIQKTYNTGMISGQFANFTAGGIAGWNQAGGVIADSYNMGNVAYENAVPSIGGITGQNDGTIRNTFTTGVSYAASSYMDAITSINNGTIINSFWDSAATGASVANTTNTGTIDATAGTFDGSVGANLSQQATYCSAGDCSGVTNEFDFANIWGIAEGRAYPYLKAFYDTAPRFIVAETAGSSNINSTLNSASLAVNGTVHHSITYTNANGLAYFVAGHNTVSNIDTTIADDAAILLFTAQLDPAPPFGPNPANVLSNLVFKTPTSGGGNPTGSIFIPASATALNTVTVGVSDASTISNTDLANAVGALGANADILYTVSGNDVTLKSSRSLISTAATTYDLNGNLSATSANITLNGPIDVTTANPALTTTTSGEIVIEGAVTGNSNALTINNAGSSSIVNGVMSDLTAFTKAGAGTLTLTENNTFTGDTTVSAGTLQIGNSGTTGALAGDIINNAALVFDRTTSYTYSDIISGTGTVIKNNSNSLTLDGASTFSGGLTLNSGTLSLGTSSTGSITDGPIGTGTLTLNGGTLTTTGGTISIANDFVVDGNVTISPPGCCTVFNLDGTGNLNSGSLTFVQGNNNNNLNGNLTGSAPINIGAGRTVTFAGADNSGYSGTITTAGQTGIATATNALGTGNIILNSGAQLISAVNGLVLNNDYSVAAGATVTLTKSSFDLDMAGAGTFNTGSTTGVSGTISGSISGDGTLQTPNSELVITSGNNTGFNGTIVIGSPTFHIGTLTISNANNPLGSGIIEAHRGTLQATVPVTLANDISTAGSGGSFTIGGSNDITLNGDIDFTSGTVAVGVSNTGTTTFGGDMTGADAITKSGAGILILTGADNSGFSGNYTISVGTLQVGNGGTTGSLGTGDVNISGGAGNLTFNRSDNSLLVSNVISGSGSVTKLGAGSATLSGTNTYSGVLLISDGTLIVDNADALGSTAGGTTIGASGTLQLTDVAIGGEGLTINGGTLSSTGTSAYAGNIMLGANSTIDVQLDTLTFNGNVDDGVGTFKFVKTGPGELRLPGAHTHKGGIDLEAGILAIGNNNSLGSGTFTFNGGAIAVTTHDLNINRNFVLNADLGLAGNNNFTLSGDITGGAHGIIKSGTSTVTLAGNNSFTGGLNITGGMVIADHSNALGTGMTSVSDGTTLMVADGRTVAGDITLNGSGYTGMTGALMTNGDATVNGDITLNSDAMIGTSSAGNDLTLAGNVNGGMALTLDGPGTIHVNGDIGNTAAPTGLTANSDLMVAADINTNGHQTYHNPVTLMSNAMFEVSGNSNQNITFHDSVTGGHDLSLMGSGTGTYQFAFNSDISQNNVMVDGGAGSSNNALTVGTGNDQTFMLTAVEGGSITGNAGVTGNFNFANIQHLIGGTGADNFTLDGGTISGSVDGAGGTNTLNADNVANIWNITSNNGGNVTGIGSFANIQNLSGGTGVDTFNLNPGFSIAGLIDGGDVVNLNNLRFDSYTTRLDLFLSLPTGNVFDAGNVYAAGNVLVAGFNRVQQSDGNGIGVITLPDKENITVTYYDATLLNGEIGDPFYFYGWSIGNPPTTETNQSNNEIAAINNQPDINENNNAAQINAGVNNVTPQTTILNTTKITPINDGNTLQTGPACYRASN